MTFTSIQDVNSAIGDAQNVDDWNNFFDLPTYGNPFTSVEIKGNTVRLLGGSEIICKEYLFSDNDLGLYIISVEDQVGVIVDLQYSAFGDEGNHNCPLLTRAYFAGLLTISDDLAFYGAEALTFFSAPQMTSLYGAAFEECISLTRINIPSCTDLGGSVGYDYVFDEMVGLNINLTIPESLMTCNDGQPESDIFVAGLQNTLTIHGVLYQPISGYSGNLTISWNNIANADALVGDASNVENWNTYFSIPIASNKFTSVSIVGNNVTLIGGKNIYILSYLFYGNNNIISVIDTGCVAYIGSGCFQDCGGLTTVDFPAATSENVENVNGFYGAAFDSCAVLSSVNIPQLSIVPGSFLSNCPQLVSVSFPNATIVENSSFSQSTMLASVSIPNATSIGDQSFKLTKISTLNLPNVTSIGFNSFQGCSSLTSVSLASCTYIDSGSFSVCTNLTNISIPACTSLGQNVTSDSVFGGITGNTISLTVPSALMTINSGNPDGDIQYLQANNTVTITTV
jgi:hypothetical protein